MRLIFFGTGAFAVPSLEAIVSAGHEVVRVITQPDRPQGRGRAVAASPVKATAQRLQLPVAQPDRLGPELADGTALDAGVALDYGKIIPPALLAWPAHGLLGVHPSKLPAYRGAAPVPWAILRGETATAVTIFRLVPRMDAGDILLQEPLPIGPDEDAASLLGRAAEAGAQLLVHGLALLAAGRARWTPQDETRVSLAPKLTKAQGVIDWRHSAEELSRLVRATVPWPGAATVWNDQSLKIWAARAVSDSALTEPGPPRSARGGEGNAGAGGRPRPGTVVSASGDGMLVATGHGLLRILEVQPPGKKRMGIREFLTGHSIRTGDRFGTGDGGQETGDRRHDRQH